MIPEIDSSEVGWLTEEQMIEVDRVMIEDLHIELIQMMENAGRNLARVVSERFAPSTVTVLAGAGGNGGGGLVAARNLANRGVSVTVVLGQPAEKLTPIPAHQFDIIERMGSGSGVAIADEPPASADVVIDALIGYSLRGAPRGRIEELIRSVRSLGRTVVSLDTPSGLNVTDGSVPGAIVNADATVTLALPKIGLRTAPQVGDLYLADLTVPPSVYAAMQVSPVPYFPPAGVLKVRCR